jgi:Golgi SNAP receptor complex protein 1
MSTYDALHRQCRTLESLFDTKLTAYARLASSSASTSQQPSGDIELGEGPGIRTEAEAEDELGDLLEKVSYSSQHAKATFTLL